MKKIITIKNNIRIIDNKYVIKRKQKDINRTFNYLKSRSFTFFPPILNENNEYIYYKYINDIDEPNEQKIKDLIILLSILHKETTIYKEIDIDYYKNIYENLNNKISNTYIYYNELMDNIDLQVYPSPSQYLIQRNVSRIYNSLNYAKKNIEIWYSLVKNKRKIRLATIHNNPQISHYIKNDKPYLISWDNTKIDIPIYDLIKLYKIHYLDYDFIELLKIYLNKYPLTKEEMVLFLTQISIPSKIEYTNNEYKNVINVRKTIDYIYKTDGLLKEYCIKNESNKN